MTDWARTVDFGDDAALEGDAPALILKRSADLPWLFCFGGLASGFGVPPFEFLGILRQVDTNVVFIRDQYQAWYQRGLPSVGHRLENSLPGMRQMVGDHGMRDIVTLGNSAGGFAAIYFGSHLRARRVVAFSPQSFLDPLLRVRHREFRWPKATLRLWARCGPWRRTYRLENCAAFPDGGKRLTVHFPAHHRLDAAHVWRLQRAYPELTLHPHTSGRHSLVKDLRDRGELVPLLTGIVS